MMADGTKYCCTCLKYKPLDGGKKMNNRWRCADCVSKTKGPMK